jgi:hypothetical protein
MPSYGQNAAQVWPRNGTAPTKDNYPHSLPEYGPQGLPLSNENPSSVAAGGGYRADPLPVLVEGGNFGRHDGLKGRLMEVAQADTFNSAVGPFPRAGTYEEPGAATAVLQLVRLQPSTSAHAGAGIGVGGGPGRSMLFVAPPVFTLQTSPIYAAGL